ncbi:hypothetical protein BU23DRAFT_440647, partial [Bimuria novae-zelandiae CBS 107.79]
GVFAMAMRMNHSCLPDVVHHYNPDTEMGTFHVIRDVQASEELTINYGAFPNRTRAQREDRAATYFGFVCACPVC